MNAKTKTAMLFIALSAALSAPASAHDFGRGPGFGFGEGHRPDPASLFERADKDKNDVVTFEEFNAAMPSFAKADANGDGKVTVEEIAAEIERMRAERAAPRMLQRLDTNGDGVLTQDEVEGRRKKLFALMDRNDDGSIEKSELPRPMFRRMMWRHMMDTDD